MLTKKTLVIGASMNPSRYSYLAINRLVAHQHPVVAIGLKEGIVSDVPIMKGQPDIQGIDTVTLYVNTANQKPYYDYIISLKPRRVIFNPGTENEELHELAAKHGIETIEACTLVLLGTGQY